MCVAVRTQFAERRVALPGKFAFYGFFVDVVRAAMRPAATAVVVAQRSVCDQREAIPVAKQVALKRIERMGDGPFLHKLTRSEHDKTDWRARYTVQYPNQN